MARHSFDPIYYESVLFSLPDPHNATVDKLFTQTRHLYSQDASSPLADICTAIFSSWTWTVLSVMVPLLLTQIPQAIRTFMKLDPVHIQKVGPSGVLGHWWTSLIEHFGSVSIINRGYFLAPGKPFAIPGFARFKVFVSSKTHLEEVHAAPPSHLSFNAAIDDYFRPHIMFNGFRFDSKDSRNALANHALQVPMKKDLPHMIPSLQKQLQTALVHELDGMPGWSPIRPHGLFARLSGRINCRMMCGERLASNEKFVQDCMRYTTECALTGEALRFTPPFLRDIVGSLIMSWSGARDRVDAALKDELWHRILTPAPAQHKDMDLLQWMLDSVRSRQEKTPELVQRLSQHAMGLLFGAAHQVPMLLSFAMYNLCQHPEYIDALKQEIANTQSLPSSTRWEQMPLLDSFLRETARLQATTAMTAPRRVMHDFTFSDGTHVPAGNWICVPSQPVMLDPANYANPLRFQGFRFAPNQGQHEPLTEASPKYTFWGSFKHPCPARFYVTILAKMILTSILTDYDFQLENPNAPQSMVWSFTAVPHPMTRMFMRPKASLR